MLNLSPEALRAAEQQLEADGTIYYQDWPFNQWYDARGNQVTEHEVETLCAALLTAQARAAAASGVASPAPTEQQVSGAPLSEKKRRRTRAELAEARASSPKKEEAADQARPKRQRAGGRPKLDEQKKLKCISTLVSPARHAELREKARELGLTISQLVRPLVDPQSTRGKQRLARHQRSGLSVEDRQRQRQVAGMSGELSQLARRAEVEGLVGLAAALWDVAAKLRAVLVF